MDMKPIPVSAAKKIADLYGYDQVIVIARRVGEAPDPFGEHVTTYGRTKEHCKVAARAGNFLKYKVMGWPEYVPAWVDEVMARRLDDYLENEFGIRIGKQAAQGALAIASGCEVAP